MSEERRKAKREERKEEKELQVRGREKKTGRGKI